MSEVECALVTGAAGFIGSTLAESLVAAGRRVVGLDNFDPFYDEDLKRRNLERLHASDSFSFVEADIRDTAGVSRVLEDHGVSGVVHLAALAGVRPSLERPAEYADVNVTGTASVLDAAVRAGVSRVVFASSSSVYGERSDGPFRETDCVERPISPYAATKRAAELVAHTFHHAHGLPIVCARIFTAYGPRQRPDLAIRKFAERIRREESIPIFGDGSSLRDFTFVDDLVAGLTAALDSELGWAILNFGAGRTVSVVEVVEILERALQRSAKIDWLPRQTGDVSRTWADVTAAGEALGYSPQTGIEEGIVRLVEWLEEQS